MLFPNKRNLLAGLMRRGGILAALERLARRPCLAVLVYHRVGEAGDEPFYKPLISANASAFREQMRWLSRRFATPTLEEILAMLSEDGVLRVTKASALVTFDDGYRDNLTIAAPIARDCGIKPALFVTTGFLNGARIPWWDRAAWIVRNARRTVFELEHPERLRIEIDPPDREAAIARAISVYIRAGWSAGEDALAHLAERAEVDLAALAHASRALFLARDELRHLAREGWSIGAHTATHRRLADLSQAEQRDELTGPKLELERLLGLPVTSLAYPYGTRDDFDATTQRLVRDAGYGAAFALEPRAARPGPVDRCALPRFIVGGADSTSLLRARVALARLKGR